MTLQFHAIKYEYKIVQDSTSSYENQGWSAWNKSRRFPSAVWRPNLQNQEEQVKAISKGQANIWGFLKYGLNMGTPKSSIYRWLFHYKPTIWGTVSPFMDSASSSREPQAVVHHILTGCAVEPFLTRHLFCFPPRYMYEFLWKWWDMMGFPHIVRCKSPFSGTAMGAPPAP